MGTAIITGKNKDGELKEVRVSKTPVHAVSCSDEINLLKEYGYVFQSLAVVTVAAGATEYVLGITPEMAEKIILMQERKLTVNVSTGGIDVTLDLLRDVTCTTDTGNVDNINANHNIDNAGLFLIHDSPATVTGGDEMPNHMHLVSDNQTAQVGGSQSGGYEMKSNTKYALKITNNGSQPATIHIFWEWAEI